MEVVDKQVHVDVKPVARSTRWMAILSAVSAVVWLGGLASLVAIVLGVIVLRRTSQADGWVRTVALIGVIGGAIGIIAFLAFAGLLAGSSSSG